MNLVQPIRDKKKIEDIKLYLKGINLRDHALFVVGINIALRISDLLKLTWGDVLNKNRKDFKVIRLIEGKTDKKREIQLNKVSQKALKDLLKNLNNFDEDDYIFKSREGDNRPLTRQQSLNILKNSSCC